MGSEEKPTTWVEHIFKKVGTLYAGIDNIISEESLEHAETQFLTAGANVKQFCSEFMQEVLPEFLKDSLLEETESEDTETSDSTFCEILKKVDDECHDVELSKSNFGDGISGSGFSTVGKEMSLKQNHVKVTLIPSEIPQVEVSEKTVGMTPSVCRVSQFHDQGIGKQIDLQSPKSVLSEPSYSSAKAGVAAEPEASKVDSSILHYCATVSAGFDESKILENEEYSTETCSKFVEAEETVAFSALDEPVDCKADQTEDYHTRIDHDCPILSSNKICSGSDFQVEDAISLQLKCEERWELIEMAGYEDHDVEPNEARGKNLKQSLQPREPKSNNDRESCESDWEIV